MAADADAPPPPPDAGIRGSGDAGSADAHDDPSYGPLRVERRRKGDGRELILYTMPGGHGGGG